MCVRPQVSDQVTGMLEVRARTDEAAVAGEEMIIGFLTEPETGAVYRCTFPCASRFLLLGSYTTSVLACLWHSVYHIDWSVVGICCLVHQEH